MSGNDDKMCQCELSRSYHATTNELTTNISNYASNRLEPDKRLEFLLNNRGWKEKQRMNERGIRALGVKER